MLVSIKAACEATTMITDWCGIHSEYARN